MKDLSKELKEELASLKIDFEERESEIKFNDFYIWFKQQKEKNIKYRKWALNSETIRKSVKVFFTDIFNGNLLPYTSKDIDKCKKVVDRYLFASKEYLEMTDRSDQKTENSHGSLVNFEDSKWFFYFYYLENLDDHEKAEPKIARLILEIRRDGDAKLLYLTTRRKVAESIGTYSCITGTRTYMFDLKNYDETYVMHLKINYPANDHIILLGLYTSYYQNNLNSGTVLLQKIEDNKFSDSVLQPILMCKNEKPEEFSNIDKCILDYLAVKKYNYLGLPKRPIPDLDNLKEFVFKNSPFEKKNTRFIDFPMSKLFIATPQTSIIDSNKDRTKENAAMKEIVGKIKSKWKDIEVVEKDFECSVNSDAITYSICKELHRTKYFILILGDLSGVKISFSAALLGLALAYCKKIMIVYKKNRISERFESVKKLGIERCGYDESLWDDKDYIFRNIIDLVEINS